MSRNFELLRRAGWSEEYLEGIPTPTPAKRSPIAKRPNLAHPTDWISALVQKLFLGSGTSQMRCVVFFGWAESGGGTSVCARAARALAEQVEDRVCVVDAKFEGPSIHRFFGKDNLAGLRDAVEHSRGGDNFAIQVEDTNLWVLPAGALDKGRRGGVAQRGLAECLRQLRTEFPYMLIDAPPLSSKSELSALAHVSDGAVLVVDSSGVTADAALRGRARLRKVNLRLLGMVLNQDQTSLLGSLGN
jgi:Mrp family chromosome partitioning ATPase